VYSSAGAKTPIQVVQWDNPKLVNGAGTSNAIPGIDLEVPIVWRGLAKPAAVKGVFEDGTYLADDWTKWMGKLQAGYLVSPIPQGEVFLANQ
jgi:endoglucanase